MAEPKKNIEIERLRGAAILIAMIAHIDFCLGVVPYWTKAGWGAVDLFFVISGFVVTQSLLRLMPRYSPHLDLEQRIDATKTELKAFFIRRIYRIYPLAVLGIGFSLALSIVFNRSGAFGAPAQVAREAVSVLSGFYNYFYPYFPNPKLSVYWSLCVEEHFYLILPLLFVALPTKSKRLWASLACLSVVALLIRFIDTGGSTRSDYELISYLKAASHLKFDAPMAGVALALCRESGWGETIATANRWWKGVVVPLCLLVLWFMPSLTASPPLPAPLIHHTGNISIWFFSGILVFLASLERGIVLNQPVVGTTLAYIGSRSYALYLFHRPIYRLRHEVVHRLGGAFPEFLNTSPLGQALQLLVVFLVCLALCELLYHTVEAPFIQRAREKVTALLASQRGQTPQAVEEKAA